MKNLMCCPAIIFIGIVLAVIMGVGGFAAYESRGYGDQGLPSPAQTVTATSQDYSVSQAQITGKVAREDETGGVNLSEGLGTATFHVTVSTAGTYSLRVYTTRKGLDTVQAVVNNGTPITIALVSHDPTDFEKDVAIQLHSGDNTIVLSNQDGDGTDSVDYCAHNSLNCAFVGGIIIYAGNPVHY